MTKTFVIGLIAIAVLIAACGPNQRIMNSAQENRESAADPSSSVAPAANSFERELNAMRNADFKFIYAFRRKDGEVLDAEDKSFITATSPPEMNRRTLADGGKALLIGSNFRMPPASLATFKTRFLFEDYSAPEHRESGNTNQNGSN